MTALLSAIKNSGRIFALMTLCLSISLGSQAEAISGDAKDFTLKSNKGKNLRLEDMRGQIVVINFWATWCGPCRQEMPKLDELYKRYKRAGVTIWGINVEDKQSLPDAYLTENPVSFPVLYDTESTVSKLYNVEAMPTTIIVDRDGKMRYLHLAYKPGYEDIYRQQIKELMRE